MIRLILSLIGAILYVPEGAVERYSQICPWKYFDNIRAADFLSLCEVSSDLYGDNPTEVYNLKGIKLGNTTEGLAPGIDILRKGKDVRKIMVE